MKNNRTQLKKSGISVVIDASYGNKPFKLAVILDTVLPIHLIKENLQKN